MAKAKPLWDDRSIEWFCATSSPTYPAGAGSIPHESRIDRGDDAVEVRACYDAIRKALETFEKPHRWLEAYKLDGMNWSGARSQLSRDQEFFPLHNRSFWPARIGYKVDKPKLMSHYFGISVAACLIDTDREFPGGMVASREVRQIIEELQPGYAKFFPVQLLFKDQAVDGYSWIIQPIRIFARRFAPDGKGGQYLLDKGDYEWDGVEEFRMRRSKLTGIHWTQEENGKHIWSSEAVRRFAPLVLGRERNWLTGLVPVAVIED